MPSIQLPGQPLTLNAAFVKKAVVNCSAQSSPVAFGASEDVLKDVKQALKSRADQAQMQLDQETRTYLTKPVAYLGDKTLTGADMLRLVHQATKDASFLQKREYFLGGMFTAFGLVLGGVPALFKGYRNEWRAFVLAGVPKDNLEKLFSVLKPVEPYSSPSVYNLVGPMCRMGLAEEANWSRIRLTKKGRMAMSANLT